MMGEVGPSPAYAGGTVYACNEYARLAAIELKANPEILWTYDDDLSEVASPVANDKLVFMAASYGTLSCFDAATGERYWYHDFDDGFYSSPILVGDLVYVTDLSGVTYVVKAGPEFELVAQNELGEAVVTTPAFAHNRIYIRGETNLYCIGE
jgi:outer membrane protein assembly factor BamB